MCGTEEDGKKWLISVKYSRRNSEDKSKCIGTIVKYPHIQGSSWLSPMGSSRSRRIARGTQGCMYSGASVSTIIDCQRIRFEPDCGVSKVPRCIRCMIELALSIPRPSSSLILHCTTLGSYAYTTRTYTDSGHCPFPDSSCAQSYITW